MVEGPFVGYGPKVDEAWDSIANDSKQSVLLGSWMEPMLTLSEQWAIK